MRITHIVTISLFTVLALTSALGQLSVFATLPTGASPESITRTAAGNFLVTDANGPIWSVPAGGGSATQLATTAPDTLRDGQILPASFTAVAGQFIVFGADTTGAIAETMLTTSPFTVSPYATQNNSVWTQSVLAPSFGSFSGDILVANQGTGANNGSVDFFAPSGAVGTVASLPAVTVPFGAALAPTSFAGVGGTLLVSDAGGSGIYSVSSTGSVTLFTTISLNAAQRQLRQLAFAPKGFGTLGNDLFVSRRGATNGTGEIDVVNRDGVVIGTISGSFAARGMLFTTISGNVTLLFADINNARILAAHPADVVKVPH